jgi:acyl carrier protein
VNASEQDLERIIVELLGLADGELDSDRPLGELGIDSLTAAELSAAIEDRFGLIIAMERFLGEETLADIGRDIGGERTAVRS